MANIRHCPTCKVVFRSIDAVNDHYKKTSHTPLPYKCESCEKVYKQSSSLQKHIRSKHPNASFLYKCEPCNQLILTKVSSLLTHFQSEHPRFPFFYCDHCKRIFDTSAGFQNHKKSKRHLFQVFGSKTPASSVIAQMNASDLNTRRDDEDDNDDDTNVERDSPKNDSPKNDRDCDAQRDPSLAENNPSALLSGNISKPLSSVSELTSPSSSSSAASGPSPSKLDKATASARAALCNRFAELGVLKSGETAPLLISNIWGPRRANSSASNLDGSHSGVATNSTLNSSNSNEKEVNLKESNVPLNSLGNITRPLTCPGCWMDFKTFSGFVLHIENHSCMSSTCHEIEDQLDACVARIFSTLQVGRA